MLNLLRRALIVRSSTVTRHHVVQQMVQRRWAGGVVTGTEKCSTPHSRGLVLGVYANEEDKLDLGCLTENGLKYNEVIFELVYRIKPLKEYGFFFCFFFQCVSSSYRPMVVYWNCYESLVQCQNVVNVVCSIIWNRISRWWPFVDLAKNVWATIRMK